MKKAVIIAFDQFTDIDVFLPWDLLNRVRLIHKDFEVKIIGTKPSHKSVCGIYLDMQGSIEESRDADLIFFASGPGTRTLYKDRAYLNAFQLDPKKQLICSMCSGALLIAAMGHLKGLSATTYPTAFAALRELGVEVIENQHLVAHDTVATAAGCLAAVDLIGWAIAKLYDEKTKREVIASVLPVGQGQACIY